MFMLKSITKIKIREGLDELKMKLGTTFGKRVGTASILRPLDTYLVGKRGEQKPHIVVTVKGEKNDNHSSDHEVDYFKDFGEVA